MNHPLFDKLLELDETVADSAAPESSAPPPAPTKPAAAAPKAAAKFAKAVKEAAPKPVKQPLPVTSWFAPADVLAEAPAEPEDLWHGNDAPLPDAPPADFHYDEPPSYPSYFDEPLDYSDLPPVYSPVPRKPASEYLVGLNAQQIEAVKATEGPLLLLAGAGSGKTRVITFRIAYLIASGVRPENILAVTFTNKAAGEMKERVTKLLDAAPKTSSPQLATFHSLCVRILRRDIEKLERGFTRSFTIYDSDDQQKLLKQCIRDCGFDDKTLAPRLCSTIISSAKNRSEDPQLFATNAREPRDEQVARVYALYEQRLASANALDFDDLLIRTVQLLRHSEIVRQYYHNRFRHVMVDEFQDTNGIQYNLTRLLVEGNHALLHDKKPADFWRNRSYCVVGDESQSIYKFRGSDFNIILNFERDFPGTRTIKLEDNYRSTGTILSAANKVIGNNKQRFDKVLRANKEQGEKIRYAQLNDGDQEARFVVGKIEDHLLREPKLKAAVLYRTNAQSRLLEECCRRAGLKYNLVGGFSFYDRAEVKDVIAYLKLALNPSDSMALLRVINTPTRGIGKTTLDDLERRAKEAGSSHWDALNLVIEQELQPARTLNALKAFQGIIKTLNAKVHTGMDVAEIVKAAVIDTGYERALKQEGSDDAESRLLNLEELVNAATEAKVQGESLRDFLDHAALVSDTDQIKSEAQVTLMTMHAAKGLEFPLVFIIGLEENLFPHSRARDNEAELEEERRLCYVAITRAEKYLYLTHALIRRVYGEETAAEPSRFLNEFPRDLIEDLSKGPSWMRFGGKVTPGDSQSAGSGFKATPYPKKDWQNNSYGSSGYGGSAKRTSGFQGKTYNDASGVQEFLAKQGKPSTPVSPTLLKGGVAKSSTSSGGKSGSPKFGVGTRVKHAKYGTGLIVKREGDGEDAKLTISFPGFGMKKMIEKFAGLEKP